jgi:tRNA (guanine37-N1)-methyltransferase
VQAVSILTPYRFGLVSLLPGIFDAYARHGVTGRAVAAGRVSLLFENPRDYAENRHRTVDDRPYGGGPGMVMMVAPVLTAIRRARAALPGAPVVALSPQGVPLTQRRIEGWARLPGLILVCGRYEGMDERIHVLGVDEECSIGDYILSGGELAAMVVMDAVTRLLPGVLGSPASAASDSFSRGLLDHPHYTRPEVFEGHAVPPVLLGGDHRAIARWREEQARARTRQRRPDLLAGAPAEDGAENGTMSAVESPGPGHDDDAGRG